MIHDCCTAETSSNIVKQLYSNGKINKNRNTHPSVKCYKKRCLFADSTLFESDFEGKVERSFLSEQNSHALYALTGFLFLSSFRTSPGHILFTFVVLVLGMAFNTVDGPLVNF